jgi:hypothetical protein
VNNKIKTEITKLSDTVKEKVREYIVDGVFLILLLYGVWIRDYILHLTKSMLTIPIKQWDKAEISFAVCYIAIVCTFISLSVKLLINKIASVKIKPQNQVDIATQIADGILLTEKQKAQIEYMGKLSDGEKNLLIKPCFDSILDAVDNSETGNIEPCLIETYRNDIYAIKLASKEILVFPCDLENNRIQYMVDEFIVSCIRKTPHLLE